MARENQGLHIALIIFVILTVLLGVTTYLFYRQWDEAARQAQQAVEREQQTSAMLSTLQRDFNTLKEKAGFDPTEEISKITEQADHDLEVYGADLDESQRSYREVVIHLWKTLQQKNATLAATQEKLTDAETRIAQLEASKTPLITQQEKRANDAEATLAQERQKFTQDLSAAQKAQQDLLNKVTSIQEQSEQALADMRKQLQEAGIKLQKLSNLLTVRTATIQKMKNPEFEEADGTVQWVDQRTGLVWINLGEADGLIPQTVFTVYPSNTRDVTQAESKGSIEVIEIRGPHLAEARIIDDVISDPILPGDKVDTLIWAPGEHRRFALLNYIDIDGDGRYDQDELINIIRSNGGMVDAYIDDKGVVHGQITASTDMLVVGNEPPDNATPDVIDARSRFIKEAEDMALQKISVRDLLRRIGYTRRGYVVRYGTGANPEDFRAKPEGGKPRESSGNVSPLFQKREPPRGVGRSAF
ncbi:hypothetical protein JCM19992_12010 [Thermostilla marina]